MDETIFALSKNVSLRENSLVQIKELTFNGNANVYGDITSASNSMTNVSSTYGFVAGMTISGPGIPVNTTISAVAGSTITMSANATATITGVPVIVGNNFPLTFRYDLAVKPIGIQVLDLYEDVDNAQPIHEAPFVSWSQSADQIIISNITGLKVNVPYSIRFAVYGE